MANHPWIDDVSGELERLKAEQQEAIDEYANSFPKLDALKDGEEDEDSWIR